MKKLVTPPGLHLISECKGLRMAARTAPRAQPQILGALLQHIQLGALLQHTQLGALLQHIQLRRRRVYASLHVVFCCFVSSMQNARLNSSCLVPMHLQSPG